MVLIPLRLVNVLNSFSALQVSQGLLLDKKVFTILLRVLFSDSACSQALFFISERASTGSLMVIVGMFFFMIKL